MSNCSRWSIELTALRGKPAKIMRWDKYGTWFKKFPVIKNEFKKEDQIFKKLQNI